MTYTEINACKVRVNVYGTVPRPSFEKDMDVKMGSVSK